MTKNNQAGPIEGGSNPGEVMVDTAVFRLEGVTKRYGDLIALNNATLEVGANVRTQCRTIHRIHLDRNELAIDESPDRMLEKLEFLRKLDVHGGDPGHARIDVAPAGTTRASSRAS